MKNSSSMSAQVRRALDAQWPGVYDNSRVHFSVIAAFVLAGDDSTTAERSAARTAAHKLNGGLGMFGRRDASSVAAAIEELLVLDTPATNQELRSLVDQLDGLLNLDPPAG
jgi:HPt (histidine-containing phosphotransfer) domain-containing protein